MSRARKGPPAVAVVTDSTAYLPAGSAELLGVQVVPLQVIVGGIVRAEGEEIGPSEVAAVLHRGHSVSTSRPSPSLFAAAYHRAFAAGRDVDRFGAVVGGDVGHGRRCTAGCC